MNINLIERMCDESDEDSPRISLINDDLFKIIELLIYHKRFKLELSDFIQEFFF